MHVYMHRSLIPSRLVPDTSSIPEGAVEEKQKHAADRAPTGSASSKAPSSKASTKGSSTRASSRSPSIAEEAPAAKPNMPESTADSAQSAAAAADHKPSPKHRTVNRSLSSASPALAFGSSNAVQPKLSRSRTGLSSTIQQPFAFGSTAARKIEDGRSEVTPMQLGQTLLQTPLQLGLGKAADAAASAGNVVGHLFGFSASDSANSRPVFGGGALGGLGSGFSFAAGSSSAGLASGIKPYTRGMAAEAAAAEKAEDDEEDFDEEEEEEHAEEEEEEEQTQHDDAQEEGQDDQEDGEEDGAQEGNLAAAASDAQTADDTQTHALEDQDEDDCNFALPDDLLSADEEDSAAAAAVDLPSSDVSHDELSEHDTGKETESHAESERNDDDTSHAGVSEADHGDGEAASQHDDGEEAVSQHDDGEEAASQHDDDEEAASQHDDGEEAASQHDEEDASHDTAGQGNHVSQGAAAFSSHWLTLHLTLSGLHALYQQCRKRAGLNVSAYSNALCLGLTAPGATQVKKWSKERLKMCQMQSKQVLKRRRQLMQKVWMKKLPGTEEVRSQVVLVLVLIICTIQGECQVQHTSSPNKVALPLTWISCWSSQPCLQQASLLPH